MALDYSKLSDAELEAIANDDYTKLSDNTLKAIASEPSASRPAPVQQQATPAELNAAQAVAPAVAGFGYSAPTGISQLVKDVYQAGQPLVEAGKEAFQGYARSPGKAIVDVGAAHLGLPPPYASMEAYNKIKNTLGAAGQTMTNIGDVLGQWGPEAEANARNFLKGLKPADASKFVELANSQGLSKAFSTYQVPGYVSEEALQSFNAVKGAAPTTMSKIGAVAGPIARGVARVAGPVGTAYNLYEAGQMARDTELGQRLAQGQGQLAEQAFRQGPVQTYQGPPLSAYEAQNVLSSGSKRDIDYFGGADRLNMIIRLQAAKKVLGQQQ